MSPVKKRSMIQRDLPDLSISQQCKLVQLSRSAFYYTPVGIDADTLAMMKEVDRVFTKYPFFGITSDRCVFASGRHDCRTSSGQAVDGKDGP